MNRNFKYLPKAGMPPLLCRGLLHALICLGCFLGGHAYAQSIKFTVITSRDGLSSNTVTGILKDSDGFMWFATPEGVDRYDGREVRVYKFNTGRTPNLQSREAASVYQDKAGRLWVGTLGGGLFLYDRPHDSFRAYPVNAGTNYLNNKYIRTICGDHLGNIWLGTMMGVTVLNPTTGKSVDLLPESKESSKLLASNILCIYEDSHNRTWIGSSQGLYCYDARSKHLALFMHDSNGKAGIASDSVYAVTEGLNGEVWVGTSNGLTNFSANLKEISNYKYSLYNNSTISGNLIYSLAVNGDKLWVGAEGGLDIMDLNTRLITRLNHNEREKYTINSKSVRCIYIDAKGISWLGTYEAGVNKFDTNLTLFDFKENNTFDTKGLGAPFVTSFAERKDGDIYVGTDGGGLDLFHVKTGLFDHIDINADEKISSAGLPILSIMLSRSDKLWIGTFRNGLFILDTKNGKYKQLKAGKGIYNTNQNEIFCFKEDKEGRVWMGTNGGGVNVFNPQDNTFIKYVSVAAAPDEKQLPINGFIRVIEQDHMGNMWIGSYGNGLAVLNKATQKFSTFAFNNTGLAIDKVFSLLEDHRGNMWIGTGGDGLFVYNLHTQKFKSYSTSQGLTDGMIHKILEDEQGNIWISTNKGISVLNMRTGHFTNYSQYNGLQKEAFLNGAGLRSSKGLLYFGGGAGFNYINPSAGVKLNKNIPPVFFTGLKVNNQTIAAQKGAAVEQDISAAKEIRVDYKNDISISFTAINFTLPQQNTYAYKLQGFNKDWINAGTNTTAYYTNIDPGEYTFMVKASNNDGVWNNVPAQIKVIIRPPFWMTWYAYILYAALIAALLLGIRHQGIKKLKRDIALAQERKDAEQLHQLDLMKIKFLTNLSHEFRTPISLIMAPADKLLAEHKDAQTKGQVAVIKRNARRLLNLVNQLLDFRKMEEHELMLSLSEGNVLAFIREVADSFQDIARGKGIEFVLGSEGGNLFARFDHDKLERILFNLLSNAFKFTPRGGRVAIDVKRSSDMAAPGKTKLEICIADTGIGINQTDIGQIFNRFFQSGDHSAGLNQGSGIGLAITKEFVELHGGTIRAESQPGKGASFTVTLMLETIEQSFKSLNPADGGLSTLGNDFLQRNTPVNTKTAQAGPLRLLIIDDNDELRSYIKDNLQQHYKVFEAADGKEGWDKVLSCHPDLIVSDVSMPHMDGVTLSKKIKGDKRTSHIPVILLTALAREEEQIKGLQSGANDYLTKPFNFEILNVKIKNLLHLNNSLKNTYTRQLKVVPADVEVCSSNEKFLANAISYIEQNLNNPKFSVVELSAHMGMSRGALYTRIFELTGKPPVEFIRSYKLDRAAYLLLKSDLAVSQIAYEAGFATPHYFSKSFKDKFGMLPSEYRKSEKRSPGENDTTLMRA